MTPPPCAMQRSCCLCQGSLWTELIFTWNLLGAPHGSSVCGAVEAAQWVPVSNNELLLINRLLEAVWTQSTAGDLPWPWAGQLNQWHYSKSSFSAFQGWESAAVIHDSVTALVFWTWCVCVCVCVGVCVCVCVCVCAAESVTQAVLQGCLLR